MKNIAIFASGAGSNFAAIARAVRNKSLLCRIALLVCDNPNALVLEKAKKAGVKAYLAERNAFLSKQDFEAAIVKELKAHNIDLLVLAGYMRILSPRFVQQYRDRIVNIHPALLPAFKGARAIDDALEYGVKVTGVTVHFVDEQTDHGPIILQKAVAVKPGDTRETLAKRIHAVEHKLYPEAIKIILSGKIRIKGRIVSF
jgi:phosphoribosylglycinamide formyltransferase-1